MIIGITGHMRSGKDEVAKILMARYGYRRFGFGDVLKKEVRNNFPLLLEALYHRDTGMSHGMLGFDTWFASKPLVIRRLLQEYGSNVRRVDRADYWVDQWQRIRMRYGRNLSVPDVRFLNEAYTIRQVGGKVIRVVRPDLIPDPAQHVSETEMASIVPDATIINDGSLVDLEARVQQVIGPFILADWSAHGTERAGSEIRQAAGDDGGEAAGPVPTTRACRAADAIHPVWSA